MTVIVFPAARIRMLEIWDYTSRTWDDDQADAYLTGLNKFFDQIAARTVPWRKVRGRRFAGIYLARFRHHCVFFRESKTGDIGIVTILHEAMNLPDRLGNDL